MSRSTKRRRIERAQMGRVISPQELQAAVLKITQQQQKLSNGKTPDNNGALFSPGQPLQTQPGVNPGGAPILWKFPVAYNSYQPDRTLGIDDVPAFDVLRRFARTYSGITLCQRVILDLVPKLKITIKLSDEMKAAGKEEKDFQKEIAAYKLFFAKPDRNRDFHSWMRVALKEQFTIDELCIFKRPTRGGGLFGLDIVAFDTMKPLLDDWGRVVAYQQFPWGVPGEVFPLNKIIRYNETPSADTPFGFSRVERVILEVNQALRKKKKDLARFTEGNIPAGMMEVPPDSNWTPDQIEAYETMWNSLLAGNEQQQVRVRFTQPGMKYTPFDDPTKMINQTEFDQFLLNITCGVHGTSMQDIAFTGDVHKSSGDQQQNVLGRRVLYPITSQYAMLFTSVIRDDFGDDRFVVEIGGFEEAEDVGVLSTAYSTLTGAGILGLSNAAKLLNLPEDPDAPHIGRVFFAKDGPVFLDDMATDELRKAAVQAKMAGFQMATNPPDDNNDGEENNVNGTQQSEKGKAGEGHKSVQGKSQMASKTSGGDKQGQKEGGGKAERSSEIYADLRRWRAIALDCVKSGKVQRAFVSEHIPLDLSNSLSWSLARCTTADQVRALFAETGRRDDGVFLAEAVVSGGHRA